MELPLSPPIPSSSRSTCAATAHASERQLHVAGDPGHPRIIRAEPPGPLGASAHQAAHARTHASVAQRRRRSVACASERRSRRPPHTHRQISRLSQQSRAPASPCGEALPRGATSTFPCHRYRPPEPCGLCRIVILGLHVVETFIPHIAVTCRQELSIPHLLREAWR